MNIVIPESTGEKIVKIGQYLAKIWTKYDSLLFFGATLYISALKGCWAMKFLLALEINQRYLPHTLTGTGSPPPKKNNREN